MAASHWRRRIAARRTLEHAYRTGVAVVGSAVVAVGLVTVPLPGPGWLTVLAGLFVLSSEFARAERLLALTERHVAQWVDWLAHQRRSVRAAVAAGTAVTTCAVVLLALRVAEVPA